MAGAVRCVMPVTLHSQLNFWHEIVIECETRACPPLWAEPKPLDRNLLAIHDG